MPRVRKTKVQKVLAMNTAGHLTYCSAPPEKRGQGRCNHLAHQEENETTQEFMARADEALKQVEGLREDTFSGRKPAFDFDDGEGGVREIEYETKPYRMSEEEKEDAEEIYGRLQLDNDYGDKKLFIHFETPLWNDTDINYYAQQNDMRPKTIKEVILGETEIVTESNDPDIPVGTVLTPFRTGKVKEKMKAEGYTEENSPIKFGTGVEAMNKAAEANGFQATTDAAVIPYCMRPSSDLADHPLTSAYKYVLNRRRNPQNQQLAYMALLNNAALDRDYQRYNHGYSIPSLADEFAGKSGIFRKYMSGRSVPYTGRAVIDPSDDVNFGEIKLPAAMAIDIFRPTLVKQFLREGKTEEDFNAFVDQFRKNDVTDKQRQELEDRIVAGNVRVLANRQPSSHLGNMQGYKPKLSRGATILLNPLYMEAFGADSDGDQMTIIGVNNNEVNESIDRSLMSTLDVNVNTPRNQAKKQMLPQKDVLYGILSVLKARSK